MRFSVRVNNDLGFAELLALAEAAERTGFDQLWVSNDLFLRSAPVLAGALAARTGRISLGISIMNPYSVHVSELAMAAATVQEVSGGRFLLGLGAGAEQFLGWAGIARTRPLATTRTALAVLRTLLGHRDVDAGLLPGWFGPDSVLRFPLGRPVPVYIGAMGPKMLEMAGRTRTACCRCSTRPNATPRCGSRSWRARRLRPVGARSTCPRASGSRCPATRRRPGRRWPRSLPTTARRSRPEVLAPAGLRPQDFGPAAALAHDGQVAAGLIDDRMLALGVAGDATDVLARCRALRRLGARHLSFGPPLGPTRSQPSACWARRCCPP